MLTVSQPDAAAYASTGAKPEEYKRGVNKESSPVEMMRIVHFRT